MADNDSASASFFKRALRRATVGALSAEVGHELQGPINLFRLAQQRLARGEALDDEDLSLLDEELDRLSRLSRRLRELAHASLERVECSPREIADAAWGGPRRGLDASLELELDSTPPLRVVCDPAVLGQALRELVDNALEARVERAGVRFHAAPVAGFCVWDDGAGLELDPTEAMSWGRTTRSQAAGLGLTLALRAARAHGFNLELQRKPPHTEAWLLIPERALRTQPAVTR